MSPDEVFLLRLLEALESAKLEGIIVGMAAAALQGAPVMTQDVDVLVRDTSKNREKVQQLSHLLGAGPPLAPTELADVLTLIGAAVPVDVIFDHLPGGLSFESVRSRSLRIPIGAHTAIVASLEDVIASKEAAGRPKVRALLPILRDTLQVRRALEQSKE